MAVGTVVFVGVGDGDVSGDEGGQESGMDVRVCQG